MLEPTPSKKEKQIPYVQGQRRSHNKTVGGMQPETNQITHLPGGRPTNWRTVIISHTVVKLLDRTPGFSA